MTDSVQVFPPGFRLVNAEGVPYSGAYAQFYDAGTDTSRAVYSDQGLTTSLGSTVYTDSAGYPVSSSGSSTKVLVYTGTSSYKIVIKDSSGSTIATHDNVKGAVISGGSGDGASGITQAQGDARYVRNPNALSAQSGIDDTDIIPFWDTGSSANVGITWSDIKANLIAENVVFTNGAVVKTVFHQAAAPSGWTKSTSLDNAGLRVVSGTGGGTGGTANFTTVFASRTLTRSNLPNTSVAVTVTDPGHTHTVTVKASTSAANAGTGASFSPLFIDTGYTTASATTGISASFNLNGGVTQDALDFAVKYADVIICSKD